MTTLFDTSVLVPALVDQLVEENIRARFTVVALDTEDYRASLKAVAKAGLTSGIVYDALHVTAARKTGCDRILTYNLAHFEAIGPAEISVSTP